MCGICGIVSADKSCSYDNNVKSMTNALTHRGPDDEGFYSANGVSIGHRRLSIIDLSSLGKQPLPNEDKTVWAVLNGEIYNYKELRDQLKSKGHIFKSDTDTEVLVHLYEERGSDCVQDLIGMFALGVWDEKNQQLLLSRDRVGKKPVLYFHKNGNFCFASEFDSLLKSNLIEKEISIEALNYYLTYGYIPAPLTIYKDVFKLMPATNLIFKDDQIKTKKYWELSFNEKLKISEEEARKEVSDRLFEAVKIRLYSDVPLGVFLSGGIDSSLVVGLMSKVYSQKIKTFSIGFDEADYNELKFARKVAERFNTDHKEFMVKPKALEVLPILIERYGEPYADSSNIPTYYVSKLSREFVTVVLNGDGGDELFAGYERYRAMNYCNKLDIIPKVFRSSISQLAKIALKGARNSRSKANRIRRFLSAVDLPAHKRYTKWIGMFDDEQKKSIFSKDFMDLSTRINVDEFFETSLNSAKELDIIDRLQLLDTLTYLPYDLLVKVDIASMANALEARSPLLDHRLMEYVASLPSSLKLRGNIHKYLLKEIAKDIIPRENIYRAKKGFGVPLAKWFRGELKDFVCDNLLSETFLKRGYFNPDAVKKMVESHIGYRQDNSFQIWTLLMLELWHKKFMD